MIDLGEFCRMKLQFETEIRQFIAQQAGIGRMEQDDSFRTLRLQIPDNTVCIGELPQAIQIVGGKRLHMAQQQHGPRAAHGDLDLRHAIRLRHAINQAFQLRYQLRHMNGKHGTGIHHHHVAAMFFAKSNQCPALAGDMAHRQPGAQAIGPAGTGNGRK